MNYIIKLISLKVILIFLLRVLILVTRSMRRDMFATGAGIPFYNGIVRIKRNVKAEWMALLFRNVLRSHRQSMSVIVNDLPRHPIRRCLSASSIPSSLAMVCIDSSVQAALNRIG